MPLVRIDLREGKSAEYIRAIGDAVHRALVECLGVPARDRFQVVAAHAADHLVYDPHYLDVERTDDVVFITVTLSAGRPTEQKQAFFGLVAQLLSERPGIRPEDVTIVLVQNSREDWSFGNGEAQYLTLSRDRWV